MRKKNKKVATVQNVLEKRWKKEYKKGWEKLQHEESFTGQCLDGNKMHKPLISRDAFLHKKNLTELFQNLSEKGTKLF